MSSINPNSTNNKLELVNINNEKEFPRYITKIFFKKFRHLTDVEIAFQSPISVISGVNKSGKSTVLMALACSHLKFYKRSLNTGKNDRRTWKSFISFTNYDIQNEDLEYTIFYKTGKKVTPKEGKRGVLSKKWSGVAKKESQIQDREVALIDVDRIIPARTQQQVIYRKLKGIPNAVLLPHLDKLKDYVSYIYEEIYDFNNVLEYSDKIMYNIITNQKYSSLNTASGEDVILNMLNEILELPDNSLILIDEIEIGLHPKVQRRLMDIIKHICLEQNKQFVITTHSPTIYSSVPEKSRIFIDSNNGNTKIKYGLEINAALSRMDYSFYPLIDLFCEDNESFKIITLSIEHIRDKRDIPNISHYVNTIPIGAADETYTVFQSHKKTYNLKKIRSGFGCVLDGDMKDKANSKGELLYPLEDNLFFLFDGVSPEKYLVQIYLKYYPNLTLEYHLNNTNNHALFAKMVELNLAASKEIAFTKCLEMVFYDTDGKREILKLEDFIIGLCRKYSSVL